MSAVSSYDPRTGCSSGLASRTGTTEAGPRGAARPPRRRVLAATSPAGATLTGCVAVADALEAHTRRARCARRRGDRARSGSGFAGEVTRTAANQLRFYGDVAAEGSYLGVTVDPATATTPRPRPRQPAAGSGRGLRGQQLPVRVQRPRQRHGRRARRRLPRAGQGAPRPPRAEPAAGRDRRAQRWPRRARPTGRSTLVVGHQAGVDLVEAPEVAAVAFTGSQTGGLALWRIANERETVIPVFAEMGTVNPVVVTRGRRGRHGDGRARASSGPSPWAADSSAPSRGSCWPRPEPVPRRRWRTHCAQAAPAPVMLTARHRRLGRLRDRRDGGSGRRGGAAARAGTAGWSAPAAVLRPTSADLRPGQPAARGVLRRGGAGLRVRHGRRSSTSALTAVQGSLAASLITGDASDAAGPARSWSA